MSDLAQGLVKAASVHVRAVPDAESASEVDGLTQAAVVAVLDKLATDVDRFDWWAQAQFQNLADEIRDM